MVHMIYLQHLQDICVMALTCSLQEVGESEKEWLHKMGHHKRLF